MAEQSSSEDRSERAVQGVVETARELTDWADDRDARRTIRWMRDAEAALAVGDMGRAAACLDAAQESAWLAQRVHDFTADLATLEAEWRAARSKR